MAEREYVEYVKIGPASAFRKAINDFLNSAYETLEEMEKLSPEIQKKLNSKIAEVNEKLDEVDTALRGLHQEVITEVASQIALQTEEVIKREVNKAMTDEIEDMIDAAADGLEDRIKEEVQKTILSEEEPSNPKKDDYWYQILTETSGSDG